MFTTLPLLTRSYIDALIAMFRGGNEEVLVRLMVLRRNRSARGCAGMVAARTEFHFSFITKLSSALFSPSARA